MDHPKWIPLDRFRLFQPAIFVQQVLTSISIHITDPQAMPKRGIGDFSADHMQRLLCKRLLGIEAEIPEDPIAGTDQFGTCVTDQIDKLGRFISDLGKDFVLLPMLIQFVASRIFKNEARGSGKPCRQNVIPAIPIKVVNPREKVVGITSTVLGLRRINLMSLREFWTFPPEGTMHHIRFPILIEIPQAGPFRKVVFG